MSKSARSRIRKSKVAQLGSDSAGKTTSGASIQQTIASGNFDAQVTKTNNESLLQAGRAELHQRVAPSTHIETMSIEVAGGLEIEWESWPGNLSLLNNAINAKGIDRLLKKQGVDVLVLTMNPFKNDHELAEYSFLESIWFIQEKTDFDLRKAMRTAADLLWSSTEEDLQKLNADLGEISNEQFREGRIHRQSYSKFGLEIKDCFTVEGCDEGDNVRDILARTASTNAANALQFLNLQAIAARRPDSTIVTGSHSDCLQFLPGIGESEFLRRCKEVFPDQNQVRLGQVLPLGSLDITIRSELEPALWIKGASPRADQLLKSVVSLLQRRCISTELRRYIAGALATVAMVSLPLAFFLTAWAVLPLLAVGLFTLAHVVRVFGIAKRGFRGVAKPQEVAKKREKSEHPSVSADGASSHVDETEPLPNRNGAQSHVHV